MLVQMLPLSLVFFLLVPMLYLVTVPVSFVGARVSTSTRWAMGTSGGRSGRARCQQKQVEEVKASGMSGSLQRQLLGCEYLISSGF